MSQPDLAARADTAVQNVSRLERGERKMTAKWAELFATHLGVDPADLMYPPSADPKPKPSSSKTLREVDIRAGAGAGGVESVVEQAVENGIVISADAVAATWEMPDAFLRGELRVRPESAWIVEIMGDSGYDPANPGAPGSLFPGDRAIIDTSDKRPSPPGPFAVFDGMSLVVKLVEMVPGSDPAIFRLVSRNPRYSSYEVSEEEANIIGRVRGRISAL